MPAAAPEPPPDLVTVRELMRLEGEQALEAARKRRHQGRAPLAAAAQAASAAADLDADRPRLVGIYGVGKRLFAEVRSGAGALLFLKGHSLPVGHVAGHDPYRLKEMAGACVRLERQGTETVLCLPRAGGR